MIRRLALVALAMTALGCAGTPAGPESRFVSGECIGKIPVPNADGTLLGWLTRCQADSVWIDTVGVAR